jgi:hypothetical protein
MIFGSTEYREWLAGLAVGDKVIIRLRHNRPTTKQSKPPGPPRLGTLNHMSSRYWGAGAGNGSYSRRSGRRWSGTLPCDYIEPLTPELQAEAEAHAARVAAGEAERKRAWDLRQVDGDIGRVEREIAHLREQLAGAEQQLADLQSKRAALEAPCDQ